MLHTELLRLINSRETWALIGSGPSIESGCPTWDRLFAETKAKLTTDQLSELNSNQLFVKAQDSMDLPAAFGYIEPVIGRAELEMSIVDSLNKAATDAGHMYELLADLPFAGYLTTNYDGLLERALNHIEPGWAAVGNVGDEVRKASGTAERVVWHIHGAVGMDPSRSRLIITNEDYDEIYLDESRVFQQLKGLLANRRIIVIGIGFRDRRMMQLLRNVGRLTDATRPIYALMERAVEFRHQIDRQVFLREYKVDVYPYSNDDGKHQNLRHTLSVYGALSIRRSLKFGSHLDAPPSYDPETTGLLIYNDLVLRRSREVPQELRTSILRARVLSICETGPRTRAQLTDDLNGLLVALTRTRNITSSSIPGEESEKALDDALDYLVADGLMLNSDETYSLSHAGSETVFDHAAVAARMEEQFTVSIRTRTERAATSLGSVTGRPAEVVCAFFRDAIERRALGVALAFATGGLPPKQDYHALALLQSTREWLDKANDEAEALCVIQTIQDIFRKPTAAESAYIATAIQARFVLHLLSLDNDTLAIRMRELRNSMFIIDANTLIPWLASGSVGHDMARTLIHKLHEAGATVVTTRPLVEEVAEHARWAQKLHPDRLQELALFEAATGRAGNRTNAFLEGYWSLRGNPGMPASFDGYLARCLGMPRAANLITDAEVWSSLSAHDIKVFDFDFLAADDATLGPARDEYIAPIRERRSKSTSYKHERQVRAEAEAIALVERARSGTFDIDGTMISNAFFVSNTLMLNQVARRSSNITMKPEAVRAWLATIKPAAEHDIRAIISELLWELQERQMDLVDRESLLDTFGPLITAAKERLEEVLPKYQLLVAQRYGGAFHLPDVADIDAPVVLAGIEHERVVELERELARKEEELEKARKQAEMSDKDRADLKRARTKDRQRQKYLRRAARKTAEKKRRH